MGKPPAAAPGAIPNGEASYRLEGARPEAHGSAAQPRPVCALTRCGGSSVGRTIGRVNLLVKYRCEVIQGAIYFTYFLSPVRAGRPG